MISLRYSLLATAMILLGISPVMAQQTYQSPEQASQSLYSAVLKHDKTSLETVFGVNWRQYLPISKISQHDVDQFLTSWKTLHKIEINGKSANIVIGNNGWVMPIPLTQSKKGWSFDIKKGAKEIRIRTIGKNELAAIQSVKAFADAQREYDRVDRNGDGIQEFAQKIISSKDSKDGLYWPSNNSSEQSPLGPDFGGTKLGEDYHGYYYRILRRQGNHAKDGAKSYIKNGKMTEGFALIAWPASYGKSGISSFIINQDGVVFEQNLGSNTDKMARAMKAFDPDNRWKPIKSDE